ncbi:MAG TPA: class I SAM-dependent methyltransferase [Pyrinomonadaceae bacterium]|nr:class I SAM-dependent methyltransferase [Pyrinomonadaceae bacterium]
MSSSTNGAPEDPLSRENWMQPVRWVPRETNSLLEVGCNVGEHLGSCAAIYPQIELSGIDINPAAVAKARENLPHADLREGSAAQLPFSDSSFDCVMCIEVLEHIPSSLRKQALDEIRRVVRPGGRFLLRVPHAGMFAFLDSNNLRFRMPRLYRALLGEGRRDAGYSGGSADVVWHHHFSRVELDSLLAEGWELEASRTGGLLLFPLTGIALWPFYRLRRTNNSMYRFLHRIAAFDIARDYGAASFDILLVLKKL